MLNQCNEWQHAKNEHGYGLIRRNGRNERVHRLVYQIVNDLDKSDMPPVVMHACDNPSCINPEHLIGGTQGDNMRDKIAKGRQPSKYKERTHCKRGHVMIPENIFTAGRGTRECRVCKKQRERKYA